MIKYKVGQKVKVLGSKGWHSGAKKDIGKTATIVMVSEEGRYYHILVNSSLASLIVRGGSSYTWVVTEKEIIPIIGEQLLFDFMED